MNGKISCVLILFCFLCGTRLDAQSVPTVHDVQIPNLLVIEALQEVAATYQTVIGFQDSEPPPYNKHINITLTHATLAQTMDAIVRADARYAWRQEPSGSVRVFSQNARFTLPGVVVSSLKIEQLGRQQIADVLNSNPDVVRWGHEESCPVDRGMAVSGRVPVDTVKVSFANDGKTLSENLDEIVQKLGTYYWVVRQAVEDSGCVARVMLPPPDEPRRKR
jgi:hypothetical protein